MVMRVWIWVSSVHRYHGGRTALHFFFPSLCHFPSLSHSHSLSPLHFLWPFLQLSACHSTPPHPSMTPTLHAPPTPHRFESSLNVDALAPRHGGVGETIPGAAAARDVHSLPPQVPEGFRYHQNCIVGQRWRVLRGNMTEEASDSERGGTKNVRMRKGSIIKEGNRSQTCRRTGRFVLWGQSKKFWWGAYAALMCDFVFHALLLWLSLTFSKRESSATCLRAAPPWQKLIKCHSKSISSLIIV